MSGTIAANQNPTPGPDDPKPPFFMSRKFAVTMIVAVSLSALGLAYALLSPRHRGPDAQPPGRTAVAAAALNGPTTGDVNKCACQLQAGQQALAHWMNQAQRAIEAQRLAIEELQAERAGNSTSRDALTVSLAIIALGVALIALSLALWSLYRRRSWL